MSRGAPGAASARLRAGHLLTLAALLVLATAGEFSTAVAQGGAVSSLGKPSAKDQVIDAVRGETVIVTLTTESKSQLAMLEFVVTDFPLHGELLSAPQIDPRTPTMATIVYRPSRDSDSPVDAFRWYARYTESGRRGEYSAPASVSIRLKDPAPILEVSQHVYFGRCNVGREAIQEMHISNVGDALYRGELQLKPPWRVVEPENGMIALEPEAETLIKVGFLPTEEGVQTFQWRVFDGDRGLAVLSGEAYTPFKPDPVPVVLKWQPGAHQRTGELTLYAQSAQDVLVSIETDARLISSAEGRAMVEANSKHSVLFSLPATDTEAYEGVVTLACEGFSRQVKVIAEASPAALEVELPEGASSINFGEIVPGLTTSRAFRLHNRGGSEAELDIELPPPFELLSTSSVNTIRPLSSRDYTVVFRSEEGSASALHRTPLTIRSGARELTFDVSVLVKAPDRTSSASETDPIIAATSRLPPRTAGGTATNPLPSLPTPLPPVSTDEDDERRTPLGFITTDLEQRQYSNRVQPVPMFELLEQRRTSLLLGWELPAPSQRQFVIDMRQSRVNTDTFAIDSVWVPWADTEFAITEEGQVRAEVRGLQPNTIYEMRVLSVTEDGRYAPPSQSLGIYTALPIDWTWFERIVILCAIALFGWIGWRFYVSRHG